MSRHAVGPLDEAEQIHALLKVRFGAPGASERRRVAAARGNASTLAFGELDALIDALLVRMRVDPRPQQARGRTRESMRPTIGPPPVPANGVLKAPPVPPDAREAPHKIDEERARKQTEPALPVEAKGPPPVPPDSLVRPPTGEVAAPPVPPDSTQLRKPSAGALPVVAPEAVVGNVILSRPGTAPETFLLYDDIVTLSSMADRDGLMISLERLLVLARLEDHVLQFVESHEVKLMSFFEAELKSFSRTPKRKPAMIENTMPRAFLRGEKVAAVLPLVDDTATITEIVRRSPLTPVETCSVLSQLRRSGLIDI